MNTLRPMDGQQADPPEPKLETTPVVDKKQLSLFDVADNRALCLNLLAPTDHELRRRERLGL